MALSLDSFLDLINSDIRMMVITIICQTLFYGIYLCLFPISIYTMITKGLQTRSRKWLFAMTIIMFVLSSMYWVISILATIAGVIVGINLLLVMLGVPHEPGLGFNWPMAPVDAAFQPINYIVADGIVVWRAFVLCPENKGILMFPVIILAINTLLFLSTVAMGVLIMISDAGPRVVTIHLVDITRYMQVANVALSLLAKFFATSVIAVKAWKYRKTLRTSGVGIRTPTRGIRILGLVVESGILYIFVGVVALVTRFIRLPFGWTLGDVSSSSLQPAWELAGLYPIVVVLLVENNCSLDTTYFSSGSIIDVRGCQPSQVEPMSFTAGPVHATGTQIEIESQVSEPRMNGHDGASVEATSLPPILPVS